jgi:hypothetical protein
MNRLQSIDAKHYGEIFVTMNPLFEPKPELVVAEFAYTHPLYTPELIEAQRLLKSVNSQANGKTNTVFCGAWANYGFHEDGLTAGLNAALLCGAQCPFPVQDSTHRRDLPPAEKGWLELALQAVSLIKQVIRKPTKLIESLMNRQQLSAMLIMVVSLAFLTVFRWLDYALVRVSSVRRRLRMGAIDSSNKRQ